MTPIPALAAMLLLANAPAAAELRAVPLDVHEFKVLGEAYDPENPRLPEPTYYRTIDDTRLSFIRSVYLPPRATVTLVHAVPDELHHGVRRMRWLWRAQVLPRKGNECASGRGDSAAAVYVTWKRGLRWYSLKFIWSSEAPLGATCNRVRNPLVVSDSIVLRTGVASTGWVEETIDPEELFRQHFANGDATAELPELQGIGVMSDGDQTISISAADYAGFTLYGDPARGR
jgi:hypothetical protein